MRDVGVGRPLVPRPAVAAEGAARWPVTREMGPLPLVLAVALSAVYLWSTPLAGDLAAQTARGQLFLRSGFVSWWAGWYGGLGTSSYSLISPALLGLLGPVLLGALSIVATPLAAAPLMRRTLRPALGGLVLSLTAAADVAVGRVTFAVGVVVALLAASAATRDWRWPCWGLAVLATFTSPVAGLLLLVVCAGIAVARRQPSVWAGCAVACLAALGVLWWLSGGESGGFEPFSAVDLIPALAAALAVALMPVGRTMRAVGAATAVALLAAFFIRSPVGQNITRLVLLGGAPVVAAQARVRSRQLAWLVLAAAAIPAANLVTTLIQSSSASSSANFVAGLRSQLAQEPMLRDHRLEVVDTETHWPSSRLLPTVTLARGWERQTDEAHNPELYGGPALTAAQYRAFLDRNAVAFVAEPRNAPLDIGTRREAVLIAAGLPYLHEVWHDADWRLYAVADPRPIVVPAASATSFTDTGIALTVPAAGTYNLALNWSPYLVASGAVVEKSPDGRLLLTVPAPGAYLVHAVWRLP